jgi:hypothetical protein
MKTIKIYTVIPYFSNGVEVFQNEVKSFTTLEDAKKHGYEFNRQMGNPFDIVENELELNQTVYEENI